MLNKWIALIAGAEANDWRPQTQLINTLSWWPSSVAHLLYFLRHLISFDKLKRPHQQRNEFPPSCYFLLSGADSGRFTWRERKQCGLRWERALRSARFECYIIFYLNLLSGYEWSDLLAYVKDVEVICRFFCCSLLTKIFTRNYCIFFGTFKRI